MGSLLLKFLAGGFAGLLAWMISEPFAPKQLLDPKWGAWEQMFVLTLGGLIGIVVGGLDGYSRGGKVHLMRRLGLGLFFGAVGATFGYGIGGGISSAVFGPHIFDQGTLPMQILARTVVFTPLGLCLGAAIGGSSLTLKRAVQGAIGGAIGAAIGGACFDLIGIVLGHSILAAQGQTSGEVGGPSRAIATTVMGAAIGLFIGLVERLSRSAWLRLNLGRNEGKEWSIDSPQTFIGRSEGAQVPLFGDPNVAPIHASIQKQGSQYILTDGGSPVGTLLNGQFVQSAVLVPGSTIQIASFALQFLVKGVPAPLVPMDQAGMRMGQPIPSPMPTAMPVAVPMSAPTVMGQPAAVPSTFALVALDGPGAGQRYAVHAPLEIGREGSGIRLAGDAMASRRHATVSPTSGGVLVQDLNSTNGTFVNGQRVTSSEARAGDQIRVGGTTFRLDPA